MIILTLYKYLFYFSIYNLQAIDFDYDENLLYVINKVKNGKQFFDVYKYQSNNHKQNIKILSNMQGHGDKYRYRDTKIIIKDSRFSFQNKYGKIIIKDWWEDYGKAFINGNKHKIDFDVLKNEVTTKGTFQGIALNDKFVVFTLSFFNSRTKRLLKNKLYIYNLVSKKTLSYDLEQLDLGEFSVYSGKYKYYEFEGLTYHKGEFYLGLIITVPFQENSQTKYKKIVLIYKIDFEKRRNENIKDYE